MKPQQLRIEVKSDPNSICNVGDHFVENWVNAIGMHPKIKKVRYFTSTSDHDCIQVIDTDGNIRVELIGNEALRLDKLNGELLKILE